jgi:hypothetical protein
MLIDNFNPININLLDTSYENKAQEVGVLTYEKN